MLRRYALTALREDVRDWFEVAGQGGRLPPRYNIAPGQPTFVVVIPARQTQRRLLPCRWGLIPRRAPDDRLGRRRGSLRLERVLREPSLRDLLTRQRCLMPATGFYAWRRVDGRIRPFHVRWGDGSLFAFAAIWDEWKPPTEPMIHTCAAILGPANPLLAPFGPDAPVVVPREHWAAWLDPVPADPAAFDWLGEPWDLHGFVTFPVSGYVNDPRHDDPGCVRPLRPPG